MPKHSKSDRDAAIARLREWLKPGDTVHTILRHVSRSGMSRAISLVAIAPDGGIKDLDASVAIALNMPRSKHDGLTVGGCGMDMGFSVVYNLSSALFRDGFECVGERCPSNDHNNGDRDHTPHHHSSGGYALRHSWL